MESEPDTTQQGMWWFICTVCYRAYSACTELSDHKLTVHNSKGRADSLSLSQQFDLQPILKITRCKQPELVASDPRHTRRQKRLKSTATDIRVSVSRILPRRRKNQRITCSNAPKKCGVKDGRAIANRRGSSWPTTCQLCSVTFPTLGRLKKHVLLLHAPPPSPIWPSSNLSGRSAVDLKQEPVEKQELQEDDLVQDDIIDVVPDFSEDIVPPVEDNSPDFGPIWKVEEKPSRKTRSGRLLGVNPSRPPPQPRRIKEVYVPGPPRRSTCGLCPKVFKNDKSLSRHEQKFHKSKEDRTCDICGKLYKKRKRLRLHIRDAHERPRDYICSTCGRGFARLAQLKCHKQYHERNHICDVCSFATFTLSLLNTHKLTHNPPSFKCNICGLLLKSEKTLFHHRAWRHSDQRPFQCQVCGKTFKTDDQVRVHRKSHSHGGGRPFLCESCPATFRTKSSLHTHRKGVHGPVKVHNCHVCYERFPGPTSLIRHEIKVHDFHRLKNDNKCKHCGKIFVHKLQLDLHSLTHETGENGKGFMCATCGKRFRTVSNLAQHSVTHLPYEELKFECEVCGKRFGIAHHVRQHTKKYHQAQEDKADKTQAESQSAESDNNVGNDAGDAHT